MNRLFETLRGFVNRPRPEPTQSAQAAASETPRVIAGFEARLATLYHYSEHAAAYERDLETRLAEAQAHMDQLEATVEAMIDAGRDRDAFEYLRLAARLRPQRDLLYDELRAFRAVATELQRRVALLIDNHDAASQIANDVAANPQAARTLERVLNQLTRYFVLLDRVAKARRHDLPERLAAAMLHVLDDRQLDLELANYVLQRRRALNTGSSAQSAQE
jgi:phage shock protein A